MSSGPNTRKRSHAQHVDIEPTTPDESQPERRTRSMRKSTLDDSLSKRARRSTVTSETSSEDGDSVRLTKTGRISKALKGQPVHKCDVCLKCYTRAEHLRRHAASHKEGAADHPESRRRSDAAQNVDKALRQSHDAGRPMDISSTRASSTLPDIRVEQSHWSYPNNTTDSSYGAHFTDVSSYDYPQQGFDNSHSAPTSTQPTPSIDGYHPHSHAISYTYPPMTSSDAWWQPHVPDLYPDSSSRSISPASLSSFAPPLWSADSHHTLSMASPSISAFSSPASNGQMYFDPTVHSQTFPLMDVDEHDNMKISGEITRMASMTGDPISHSSLLWLEDRYAPFYYRFFHPCFPILHRQTLDTTACVPNLLKILIIAIGASFCPDQDAGIVAQALSTTADTILKRCVLPSSRCRTLDLQVAFLAEAFIMFHSRRPSIKLSSRFEALVSLLQLDPATTTATSADTVSRCASTEELVQTHADWMDQETRRRLLLACYSIESQQAALVERHRNPTYLNMSMPCSAELWEAPDSSTWQQQLINHEPAYPTCLYDAMTNSRNLDDPFIASIMIAFLASHGETITPEPTALATITSSPQGALIYHATQLVSHIPLRSILAVAGESFVLGHKIQSMQQYGNAKTSLDKWTETEGAAKAMYHAARLLRLIFDRGTIGILWEDWTLYLAALVCWTVGIWTQSAGIPRIAGPLDESQIEPQMRSFLARFNCDGENASTDPSVTDYVGTKACLAWTSKKIAGQGKGGLVSDAHFVLKKLVKRLG